MVSPVMSETHEEFLEAIEKYNCHIGVCHVILMDGKCGRCNENCRFMRKNAIYCASRWWVCPSCYKKYCRRLSSEPENKEGIEGKIRWVKC